jgi:hypothetical protein
VEACCIRLVGRNTVEGQRPCVGWHVRMLGGSENRSFLETSGDALPARIQLLARWSSCMIHDWHHNSQDSHECTPPHARDLLHPHDHDQLDLALGYGGAYHLNLSNRGARLQRLVLSLRAGPFRS